MTDLTIGSETFRVEVAGDAAKPALILSNSLGADLTMWDGQMPALTEHFRVIRYDPRGHGGSSGGGSGSLAQLGQDALAILDALDVGTAHWVGLSMGGAVGMWVLANAPHRIGRAVLANTAPRIGTPESWNARITSVLADGMEKTTASSMERWFSAHFTERQPDRVAAIRDIMSKTSPQGYAACCAALRDMDLREALRGVDHEILVVTGRNDPVVPKKDATALVAGLKAARHVALVAHHISNIEAEDAFNTAVLAFLTAEPSTSKTSTSKTSASKTSASKTSTSKTSTSNTARGKPPSREAPPVAKVAPAAGAPAKRGGATRRSNAARRPLKKAAAKKMGVGKKKPAKTTAKATAARRSAPKTTARKTTARKAAAKIPRKTVSQRPAVKPATRRPTPTVAARGPVKTAAKKSKPSKAAAKKKPVTKSAGKSVVKSAPKKLPAARRKPVTKPRRPSGRRKS